MQFDIATITTRLLDEPSLNATTTEELLQCIPKDLIRRR
jgi:hypothetical protein